MASRVLHDRGSHDRQDRPDALRLAAAADAMRFTGQLSEAVATFDAALALDPTLVAAWYGRGLANEALGLLADACSDFARVTDLAPATAPGFAGLASVQAQLGETAAAHASASRALALAPGDPLTAITLARCAIARGDAAAAVVGLEAVLARAAMPARERIRALGLLGDALDATGRIDAAFDAYARANAVFAASAPSEPPARLTVEAIEAALAPLPRIDAAAVAGEAANHVFLLGYPRSGTTLVEQVLATVPGVATLEEAPTLVAGAGYLTGEGIARLGAIDDAEAVRLRADYWARVAAAGTATRATFVDMDPFKAPALPLIARLFPRAKVVVVDRDPRDVVWSCFRRSFVASPVAREFTTLDRAARHHAAVRRLTARCVAMLPLAVHRLAYEDLVADFDATTRALCGFTGLPWSPALRDFNTPARARAVRTASAAQVRQPLYDGSGQWRRYARHLAPVLPLLEPWVRRAA